MRVLENIRGKGTSLIFTKFEFRPRSREEINTREGVIEVSQSIKIYIRYVTTENLNR